MNKQEKSKLYRKGVETAIKQYSPSPSYEKQGQTSKIKTTKKMVEWLAAQLIREQATLIFTEEPLNKERLSQKWEQSNLLVLLKDAKVYTKVSGNTIHYLKTKYRDNLSREMEEQLLLKDINDVYLSFHLKEFLWTEFLKEFKTEETWNKSKELSIDYLLRNAEMLETFFRENFILAAMLKNSVSNNRSSISTYLREELSGWAFVGIDLETTIPQMTDVESMVSSEWKEYSEEEQNSSIKLSKVLKSLYEELLATPPQKISFDEIPDNYYPMFGERVIEIINFFENALSWIDDSVQISISMNKKDKQLKKVLYAFKELAIVFKSANLNRDNFIGLLSGIPLSNDKVFYHVERLLRLPTFIYFDSIKPKGVIYASENYCLIREINGVKIAKLSDLDRMPYLTNVVDWTNYSDSLLKELLELNNDEERRKAFAIDLFDNQSRIWAENKFLTLIKSVFNVNDVIRAVFGLSVTFFDRLDNSRLNYLLVLFGKGNKGKSRFFDALADWMSGKLRFNSKGEVQELPNLTSKTIHAAIRSLDSLQDNAVANMIEDSLFMSISEFNNEQIGKNEISTIKSQTGGDKAFIRKLYTAAENTATPANIVMVGNHKFIIPPSEQDSLGRRVDNIRFEGAPRTRDYTAEELRRKGNIYDFTFYQDALFILYNTIKLIHEPVVINSETGLTSKGHWQEILTGSQNGGDWRDNEAIGPLVSYLLEVKENAIEIMDREHSDKLRVKVLGKRINRTQGAMVESVPEIGFISLEKDSEGAIIVKELHFKRGFGEFIHTYDRKQAKLLSNILTVISKKQRISIGKYNFESKRNINLVLDTIVKSKNVDIVKPVVRTISSTAIEQLNELLEERDEVYG